MAMQLMHVPHGAEPLSIAVVMGPDAFTLESHERLDIADYRSAGVDAVVATDQNTLLQLAQKQLGLAEAVGRITVDNNAAAAAFFDRFYRKGVDASG
jgi:hypothetical protein